MKQEATVAGMYHSEASGKDYPRVQILTIRELLEEHRKPEATIKKALQRPLRPLVGPELRRRPVARIPRNVSLGFSSWIGANIEERAVIRVARATV